MAKQPLTQLSDAEFTAYIHEKRIARMDKMDKYPPALRALIHEYGYMVVDAFIAIGVTKPKHIEHLIKCVLRELSPMQGSYSKQGLRTEVSS